VAKIVNMVPDELIGNLGDTHLYLNHVEQAKEQIGRELTDEERAKLMDEKWDRELCYLTQMANQHPNSVPEILDVNLQEKKIYLKIDGVDLWQRSLDQNNCAFDLIVPDWQEQMLSIFKNYIDLNLWKYSLHPSSYFIVDGKLKSINYFFNVSRKICLYFYIPYTIFI
jgi:hypothetical protein